MERLLLRARALSDPTRLKLLRLLLERESAVHELVDVLATGQSRVSMHLAKLKAAGLVQERREGREMYYAADSAAVMGLDQELLRFFTTAVDSLPELRSEWRRWQHLTPAAGGDSRGGLPVTFRPAPAAPSHERGRHGEIPRVLFLCTANSFRSQLAEAWARHLGAGRLEAQSAGLEPARINRLTEVLLREVGVDMAGQYAKPITPALLAEADVVVTVCGTALGWFPEVRRDIRREHWPFPDPTLDATSEAAAVVEGRRVRDGIRRRVESLLTALTPAS